MFKKSICPQKQTACIKKLEKIPTTTIDFVIQVIFIVLFLNTTSQA